MIDVVIPTCLKDLDTLEIVIAHAKRFVKDIGNIYVISDKEYTKNAIHIPESLFPFNKEDVYKYIPNFRCSWYYQQLLKLYAHVVITQLSDSFLILDSETIFYKPVNFVDDEGRGLYCVSDEKSPAYYAHMRRFVPELKSYVNGVHPQYSGIVHHMLFQRCILDDLFIRTEKTHNTCFWKAFLNVVEDLIGGASEYEIYFCFAFAMHPDKVAIRHLNWALSDTVLESSDRDFLTAHAHLRRRF